MWCICVCVRTQQIAFIIHLIWSQTARCTCPTHTQQSLTYSQHKKKIERIATIERGTDIKQFSMHRASGETTELQTKCFHSSFLFFFFSSRSISLLRSHVSLTHKWFGSILQQSHRDACVFMFVHAYSLLAARPVVWCFGRSAASNRRRL